MMSQTELLAWSEPDTKFFADNLLGVEDWGDSITDVKFNPDDLFGGGEDDDMDLEGKGDHLSEFLSSLGDSSSSSIIEDFDFPSGVCIKEEPLSPSSSNSSCVSLPSSPENQFLINGESSPVHQPNAEFDLSQTSLLPASPSCIKTEATLAPLACNVKQEKIPMQSCGVKSIQPMPVVTAVPVGIQNAQIGHATTKPAGGIPVYIPCTGSLPSNGVVSVVVGKNVNSALTKPVNVGITKSSTTSPETDAKILKRQQRMIKNRESACLSRKKKKEYLQSLESKVKEISNINESLRAQNEGLKRRVNELEVENALLRSKHPELTSTIKKSTCVLAVVLFVALNVGPFSNLKEQWKFNKADLLPGSVVRHGRALLNYQGDGDVSDIDKPIAFSPFNQRRERKPFAKAHPSMLNTSHKKSSLLKSRNVERKDLMVIRNKWDFLGDSRQKRRNTKRNERNPKLRRKIAEKQHNATLDDDQFYCPSNLNKTEVNRINEALVGWVRRYENQQILKQKKQRRRQTKMQSAIKELALRLTSNCTTEAKRKISRHKFLRKHNTASTHAVQLFQRADKFKTFEEEINKKSDTLYIVSFRGDHLVFPATEYNATQRPKMSFMIMAPPNRTEWQRNNARKTDLVTMMQIDCQVMDTKFINIKKSSIPMPHPDSSSFGTSTPVSVPRDFSAPSGNTFVKPAK
ncbi:cyclic AMP-dependent transcription factor ATF-6 beta-like isoform X1 [Stylophora pistillata]|uniref:Cyclic AMP-dependent transcription factor ATF-6 alpha n=1 Tax=Stylophora pistillata TaxID=50429 RepID=A0A2B4SH41_STYPI|nr:cyclic AMP-dependent transcription factor ATF-6 beta-like isoform X1 [Stylophora pistillata]PFX27867.1 Cyclic AMP-dependent transcription factor ATF-6 alpha [Stylophora pistillata]